MMKSPRLFYLLLALFSAALLSYAYYLQFVDGLEPCPLCIFQRLAYMAVIVVSLVAFVHGPGVSGMRIYSGLLAATTLVGAAIAGRHVWLQHLPADKVPECGPGLDYMLEVFSLGETLRKAFSGSGECALIDWSLLGLSMAEWSLLCFTGLFVAALVHCIRGRLWGQG